MVSLPRNEKQTYRLNSRPQMWPMGLTLTITLTFEFWRSNVTLTFDHTHDLDHGFSWSNFEIAVSQNGRADWHCTKGGGSRSFMTMTMTIWWPRSGVWIYQIVTGVTSVAGVPSTHLVMPMGTSMWAWWTDDHDIVHLSTSQDGSNKFDLESIHLVVIELQHLQSSKSTYYTLAHAYVAPNGQMTMTLHTHRSSWCQRTSFGVNQPSGVNPPCGCWVLISARFQEPFYMPMHRSRWFQWTWFGMNWPCGCWVTVQSLGWTNGQTDEQTDRWMDGDNSIFPFFL